MKIHEYNEMMRYLTRPKDKLSFNERKALNEKYLKNGGAVPEAKPMPIVDYINKMNFLYGNGGEVKKAEAPHGTEPDYYEPREMEDIKKSLNVSPMVKKPKKQIIKKTLIVEKPRPVKPPIIDYLELQDWINTIDPNYWEEKPNEKVLLRVPKRELKGLASLLNVG